MHGVRHPVDVLDRAEALLSEGLSFREVGRRMGLHYSTIIYWYRKGFDAMRSGYRAAGDCSVHEPIPASDYAYLLGLYLGDGTLSQGARLRAKGIDRLRIFCDAKYPRIIEACADAMKSVLPNKVGVGLREGCREVHSDSKHWPCLFPQHGPGRKHERPIVLEPWQIEIVTLRPKEFLRGLIHSDGCRCINRVTVRGKRYEYPRYFFSNHSLDIQQMFRDVCEHLGIQCQQHGPWEISVAKRDSVALLDTFVGPKS